MGEAKIRRQQRAEAALIRLLTRETDRDFLGLDEGTDDRRGVWISTPRSSGKSLYGTSLTKVFMDTCETVQEAYTSMDIHDDWHRMGKAKKGGRTKWPDVRKLK